MDDLDRRILRELQRNGSLTHADLAQKVGASSASCWRRVRALEGAGVLQDNVRLVDAEQVNCGVSVMCQLRMKSHEKTVQDDFETYVRSRAEIMECHSMSGEWDYLMRVVVSDVSAYERFLMRDLLRHPSVATAASHFALSQIKYTTALPV